VPGFTTNNPLEEDTVSISLTGSTYTQDFNSLSNNVSTGTGSVLPADWTFIESGTGSNTTYRSGTGSANNGDTYSFGADGSTERAFGLLRSGSVLPTLGVSFTNDTGTTITALTIGYTGEQWRLGATSRLTPDRLDFQYSLDANALNSGTWTDADALDFIAPISSGTVGALDGNAAANSVALGAVITDLSIAPGQTFWLRWTDVDVTGADDGLAIDDFTLGTGSIAPANAVNLSVSAAVALESAGTSITVTATTTTPVDTEQTASLQVSGSGVTAGDYMLSGSVITIPAGATSGSVTFTVLADGLAEDHETAQLSLADPSEGITLGPTSAQTVVIADSSIGPQIAEIQGAGHISALLASPTARAGVQNVQGIVTAVASNGFYLQDPTPDDDDATSDAIFVFTNSAPGVQVGDALLVSGTVSEFRPGNATTLTVTQISHNPAVKPLLVLPWTDAPGLAIVPLVLGVDRMLPTQRINDDFGPGGGNVETGGDFDPVNEGIDFWESLEGMLVSIPGAVAVSPTAHFGDNEEIWVLANGGAGATGVTERGGIAVSAGDFNPERIQIDDLSTGTLLPEVDVGARFADMTGVVSYNFGNYEVQLPAQPTVTQASTLQRETTTLTGSAGALTVGTFNVENLDPGDSTFAAIAAAIKNNLGSPDILCVEEIQDNNGATNNGVVDASVTFQTLIDAIVAAGGPRYEYQQIDPVNGADGGEPGGNIRTGFLFNPARVDFVEGSLQRLEDPVGGAFQNSRKPLVAEFVFNGEHVTVIGNHFNSKGGDQPLFGTNQPPVLSSEAQRMQQATIVADHVDGLLSADAGASVIVLGDLNDFEFSAPVGVLEAVGLTSLVETLPANQRYSYNFEGNAQVLDHIMVSPGLLAATTGFDIVHMNSEFSAQLSDHDPSVARFSIAEQMVLVGRFGVDTLVGGDGHDTLTGLQGRDLLIGGDGDDRFVYTRMLDLNDLILDFEPGMDTLVVGALLADIGYAGDDPLADGTLGLIERAGRTYATVDRDGSAGEAAPRVIAELVGVTLDELSGATVFDAGALT
jgi:predicted extracellular nuclease